MLYIPTTMIMAADAQRRHVSAARLDGATVEKRRGAGGLTATLFHRRERVAGRGLAGRRFTAARTAS
jgi:hypothetical protein